MNNVRVLFVCLGNICRSPTAEGVFRQRVEHRGLSKRIDIDSAGTSDWHIGRAPDQRTINAAAQRGYALDTLRGRQVVREDFYAFDYVLAMDISNLNDLQDIQPSDAIITLDLFLNYAKKNHHNEVPDPYYGGEQGFELVIDLIEDAAEGLLDEIVLRLK